MFIEFSLKAVGPYHFYIYIGQLDTPMICIMLYKSLDTHKKKTKKQKNKKTKKNKKKLHMVVTKNKDGMDLYTMRENDNYN